MRVLLLGCGNNRDNLVRLEGEPESLTDYDLVTVDIDPHCGADLIWDLEHLPLPFSDNEFDWLCAFDVLEHTGKQGDWRFFFDQFSEFWRILKPGGQMRIMIPIGLDALADPGHTRFFWTNHFFMLSQRWYAESIEAGDRVTDYRWYWKHDFEVMRLQQIEQHHIAAVLEKRP